MTSENPNNWTEVKKVKFHHRVKNFYYKNLFRKIYTIAIIGLIGANIFSIVKYVSFADELEGLQQMQNNENVSYATLLAGEDFNVKIKKLAGQSEAKDYTTNTSITSIKRATQLEEGLTDDNIISTGDSEYVIYAWFDSSDGTIYYHTDANKVQMNADSSSMFQSLQGLSGELDISSWDTSNVTNMGGMFYGVTINSGLDLSSWDTSNVNDMNYMFAGLTINSDLGLSSWDTSSVTNMRNMFYGVTINTGLGLSNWDISNVTNMSYMFNSATINTELGLSNWDMSNVTNMTAMFGNSTINSGLDLSNWIINSRVNSPSMFIQATINSELDLSNWVINSGAKLVLMFDMARINSGLDLSNWVIGSGADVHDMFQGLTINSELDLSNWVIGSGADVWWMFDVATINSGLDLSNWVINSGVNSNAMFSYATINSELDLSNWVISSETNMNSMFYGTKVNSELDLSNWIISGANMTAMFGELQINTKLDLSSWDISNEPNMTAMFYQAQIKSGLDLSNWDTSSVTNMNSMFYGAQIPTIYVTSGFDTSNVTSSDNLFTNSTVVGGNGTVCNTALDTSYLRIDREGKPGCFTEKVCEEGYRLEGGQCVSNTKTLPCTQSGKPDNSSYNVQDVEVLYNTGTDTWSIAENCSWVCDNGYTENNGKCEQIKSHGGSSGRGRSSSINKKHDSASDETSNTSDENPEESNENLNESVKDAEGSVKDSKESDNETTSKGQNIAALNTEKYDINYSTEQNQAYQFARGNKITTTSTIREAKMNSPLTRIEMAKMLSYYAMNVLKQTPDISKSIKFSDISDKLDAKYDNGVTLAYQLGIMGINMPNNKFRPNDKVTRAEFATALSRMLYGIEDGKGKIKYYEPHMAKLYNEGIINKVDPKMLELRGYVMIMLMRTAK